MVERLPRLLLRLEGLAAAAAAIVLYFHEATAFKDTHLSRV
jgi:hypothetical protein